MRAPEPTFADAINAYHQRYRLPREEAFFARVRQCTCVPPERRGGDYLNLADALSIAWAVARVWPDAAKKHQLRREDAARKLEAVRLLREDEAYAHLHEPLPRSVKQWLDEREQTYAADAVQEEDRGEVLDLEYVRYDYLTPADLGREHRSAGVMLFVREVSAAMRAIFGKPHDKVVGELVGLAFETGALSPRTVQTMRGKTTLTQPK
jgi:hypothetical protein